MPSLYQTPDQYLQQLIQRVRDLGSRITDFNIGSGARTLFEAESVVLAHQSGVAEQLRQDSYLATATGDALDRKAADYQVVRKAAVAATGQVTITRQSTAGALSIPAGWGKLQTIPVPGQATVGFQTTADAVFADTVASVTVDAIALDGGTRGNIADDTPLITVNPIVGVSTDSGVVAAGLFGGGVDVESDDDLRARVPLEVQGRVLGRKEAFLARALRTPGVRSAAVLRPADDRGDGTTLAAGHVEVYFKGSSSLLSQVTSEVATGAVLSQDVATFVAAAERLVAVLTVYVLAGVDTARVGADVKAALFAAVDALQVGDDVKASQMIRAVHAIDDVQSAGIPFTDLRKFAQSSGTTGDVVIWPIRYASLATADITVNVVEL